SGGDVFDLIGDVVLTDEDGDTRMDDSTRVSTSLGGEISLGGRKSRELNSDNTGGITIGVLASLGGEISSRGRKSWESYSDNTQGITVGEKTSVAKRYLVKSFEKSGEVFPGVAGK
nr:hypothetical protein [Tanacetum cinerariifolium]